MPDHKEMYTILLPETTKAIRLLQEAQQKAEEIYMSDDPDDMPAIEFHDES